MAEIIPFKLSKPPHEAVCSALSSTVRRALDLAAHNKSANVCTTHPSLSDLSRTREVHSNAFWSKMAELFPSNLVPRPFPSLLGEEKVLETRLISTPSSLSKMVAMSNSPPGVRPHSQSPVSSPIPPSPPQGLNIDRCLRKSENSPLVEI